MNFTEFKTEVLARAKKAGACESQYKRALNAQNYEELAEIIKDNLSFNRSNEIVTYDFAKNCDKPEIWNIGKENIGLFNSGDRNSGDLNSGDRNSGYRNSGDLNSGYRNSGIFCNKKREDFAIIFNKESNMTWDEWFNHSAYNISCGLEITKWIDWENITDDEKKNYPKAFVCGGYVKVFDYRQAWENLWKTLSETQKASFKTLPNFDSIVFEDITGIKF